jgi:hypothetical protein
MENDQTVVRLEGKWIFRNGKIVGDEAENRIWELVENHFVRVAERDSGWVVLFNDPTNDSFWELSFPEGELQGGGPAQLTKIERDQIQVLYADLNRNPQFDKS